MLHIVLTFIRQEIANKWYHNTVNDFLLPNTVNQKDEKQYTTGLDDGTIPHIKSKLPKYRLKKSSIPQYRNHPPPFPPILTPATKAEGAKLHVCYCSPARHLLFLLYFHCESRELEFLHVNPTKRLFRLLGSSLLLGSSRLHVNSP